MISLATLAALAAVSNAVIKPVWLKQPDADAIAEVYPNLATTLHIEGRVVLSCIVSEVGKTRNCEVVSETPQGFGFGAATLELAKDFELKPLTVAGVAIDGGEVRVPIRFKLPDPEPTPPSEARSTPTPSALQLAAKVFDAVDSEGSASKMLESEVASLEREPNLDVGPEVRLTAIRAYRQALAELKPILREANISNFARNFTEPELQDILTFFLSSGGRAMVTKGQGLARDGMADMARIQGELSIRARAKLCANFRCELAASPKERIPR